MELLGHWWYEGPRWLAEVVKKASANPNIALTTCSGHLERQFPETLFSLPEGSWGEGGFHWVWLNEWTEWTWKHIYPCEEEMCRLAGAALANGAKGGPEMQRVLSQLGRELLLLESSDWQFLITTWSARDYAEMRFLEHLESFRVLSEMARRLLEGKQPSQGDLNVLGECEGRDSIFPEVDPAWYAAVQFPAGK
jgi:1,4-alpha-glucan branching enzyme